MIIVFFGVCGCGKTTTGQAVAAKLGWKFADGDDFHTELNKQKMSQGIPLTDEDRLPWLLNLHHLKERWNIENVHGIIACSALKRSYRRIIEFGLQDDGCHDNSTRLENTTEDRGIVNFVLLNGSYDVIAKRMQSRRDHFMNPVLLQSQIVSLEYPTTDENAIVVDISRPVEEIVDEVHGVIRNELILRS